MRHLRIRRAKNLVAVHVYRRPECLRFFVRHHSTITIFTARRWICSVQCLTAIVSCSLARMSCSVRAMNVAQDQPALPDPHAGQPLLIAGPAPEQADATLVLVHGRGASADSILSLWAERALPTLAALAPQAAGNTWYPNSFLAPIEANQPYLDSAVRRLECIVADLSTRGIRSDRIALLGFSQGACLVSEFTARNPRRYAAVVALTGGLIGPPGTRRDYAGSLDGTPVFLGTSDPDPHVPFERVRETEGVLTQMGAVVELRRYPGMPHTINQDELDATRELLQRVVSAARETRP
jgi:predicted esterase